MITAYVTGDPFDHMELYRAFLERETDGSGTVVLHHGMVKRPGKLVPDFSKVELKLLTPNANDKLENLARKVKDMYKLNQVLIVHRLGIVGPRGTVLLAIVSGATRDRCFAACSFLVDEIKKEEFIQLIEHP